MRKISRTSLDEDFDVTTDYPIPETPSNGARIKVQYAGACYTSQQAENCNQRHLRLAAITDTSLIPGYEVAGIIDDISPSAEQTTFREGDRVILYPGESSEMCAQEGILADYVTVSDLDSLVIVPDNLPLDVAVQLPCGALRAYASVTKLKSLLDHRTQKEATILIFGAGSLGLWTLKLAKHLLGRWTDIRLVLADTNLEKLNTVKATEKIDVIHWNEAMYEQQIMERMATVCTQGADVIIDYASSPRSIKRAIQLLNQDGILAVGGMTNYEVCVNLNSLAQKNQTLLGVSHGNRGQLQELIDILLQAQIVPPESQIFPVEDATRVFRMMNESKITGRTVLSVS